MRRPIHTPTAVPTTLTMNAVMKPTYSPSHQPIQPPMVAPKKAKRLLRPSSLADERGGIDQTFVTTWICDDLEKRLPSRTPS